MEIKKLYKDCGLGNNYVAQLCDGSFARFLATPFRQINEKDFIKMPYYRAVGRRGEEAEPYIYKLYGLEKEHKKIMDASLQKKEASQPAKPEVKRGRSR